MIKKLALAKGEQTVFSLGDMAQVLGKQVDENLNSLVHYYVKRGDLIRLAKGLYTLDKNYNTWELGNKLRSPSYVSLYTVLQKAGAVFQPYESIFLVGNRSEIVEVAGQRYVYRKVKDLILFNNLGVKAEKGVAVAEPERALLDKLYLDGEEYFDNLAMMDWERARKINQEVYKSKLIARYIEKTRKE